MRPKTNGCIQLQQLPSYSPLSIMQSDDFYDSLIKAADLADFRHESSFIVHGGNDGFRFTRPLQESEDMCAAGKSTSGINYSKPGYGRHIPPGRFSVIEVHFHTPDTVAIPSFEDLETQLSSTCTPMTINGNPHMIFGADIMSHRNDKGVITLLCSQLVENIYLTLYNKGLD